MGWSGIYIFEKLSMRDIRKEIEKETNMTCVGLKFGHAVCVVTQSNIDSGKWSQEYLNFITIVLWSQTSKEFLTKLVDETMGPTVKDVPLKWVKLDCKIKNQYSTEWRKEIIQRSETMKINKNRLKTLKRGDTFTVYGEKYSYSRPAIKKNHVIARNVNGKEYSIKTIQIQFN